MEVMLIANGLFHYLTDLYQIMSSHRRNSDLQQYMHVYFYSVRLYVVDGCTSECSLDMHAQLPNLVSPQERDFSSSNILKVFA